MTAKLDRLMIQCARAPDIDKIITTVESIARVFDEFEHRLSMLPFLWFLNGVAGSTNIYDVIKSRESRLQSSLLVAQDYVPPILAVLSAAAVQTKLSKGIDLILHKIAGNRSLEVGQKVILATEVKSLAKLKLTGMSFFNLNKEFLVSYLGSVLTFAVLIAGFKQE